MQSQRSGNANTHRRARRRCKAGGGRVTPASDVAGLHRRKGVEHLNAQRMEVGHILW